MKKRISVMLAWTLAGLVAVAFFLPWVRPAGASVMDVSKQLRTTEDSWVDDWIGMKTEEWQVAWQRPTMGLSGFQLSLLDSEEGIQAEEAKEWLAAVFGERHALGRTLMVLPFVLALLSAAFFSPRKPVRAIFGIGALLLAGCYVWGRWRLDATYDARVLANMEISYALWVTLYATLALAILGAVKYLNPKGKW